MEIKELLGKKWIGQGKAKTQYTVIDILTTKNISGDIVKIELLNSYKFLGETKEYISPVSCVIRGQIKE